MKRFTVPRIKPIPIFWRFQLTGWICFVALYTSTFQPDYYDSWSNFLGIPVNVSLGIAVTYFMRLLYIRLQRRKLALLTLVLAMLGTSAIAAVIWMTSDYWISGALWGFNNPEVQWSAVRFIIATDTAILFGWSLLFFSLKLWLDWNNEKKRSDTAIQLAREAQLQLLRYQLNPHFLFNSLNSIRTLVDENSEVAKQIITELAEFFRYSLLNRDVLFAPLRDEFKAMRHYFAIQRIRYEDRLIIQVDITPEAEDFPVLSFMVQPFVENAIKYGMRTSEMPLRIVAKAEVVDRTLRLEVSNTGAWVEPSGPSPYSTGTGLNNIRKALENAYPGAHRLEIGPEDGWVKARIEIDDLREKR